MVRTNRRSNRNPVRVIDSFCLSDREALCLSFQYQAEVRSFFLGLLEGLGGKGFPDLLAVYNRPRVKGAPVRTPRPSLILR